MRRLVDLQAELATLRGRQTRILVVGRTGVGKSSTINSILGGQVAEVGDFEPTTPEIRFYNGQINESPVLLIDTPGFCDARPDRSNDGAYVDLIKRLVGEIDLLLLVTRLDDPRVDLSEWSTLKVLSESLTRDIWQHSLVVLTRADMVTRADFDYHLNGRSAALRKALAEANILDNDANIPFIPVSNKRQRTPDRRRWMTRLWLEMLERMRDRGFEPFVLATINRVDITKGDNGNRRSSSHSGTPPTTGAKPARRLLLPSPAQETQRTSPSALVLQPRPPHAAPPPITTTTAPPAMAVANHLEHHTYVDSGTRIVETRFQLNQGIGPIIVNSGQVHIVKQIVERRAPRLITAIQTAAVWVANWVRPLFGW